MIELLHVTDLERAHKIIKQTAIWGSNEGPHFVRTTETNSSSLAISQADAVGVELFFKWHGTTKKVFHRPLPEELEPGTLYDYFAKNHHEDPGSYYESIIIPSCESLLFLTGTSDSHLNKCIQKRNKQGGAIPIAVISEKDDMQTNGIFRYLYRLFSTL